MRLPLAFAALAATAAIVATAPAQAGAIKPYDKAAVAAAQAQGKPVVIFVHAPWCPVCAKQGRTIDAELAKPAYKDLIIYRIDFDTQKDIWRGYGVTQQSTLIAYHGTRETARLAHDADPAKVSALLASSLR